ncbi:MAG: hypothetical protein ACOH5I_13380 [Oligoflexus sp.]
MQRLSLSAIATLGSGLLCASALTANPCESKLDQWPYAVDFGGQDANIFFEAGLEVNRDCRDLGTRGYAAAGAGLLGLEALLIESDANLGLIDRRHFELHAGIAILGFVVDSYHYETVAELQWQDQVQFPIDLSSKELIMVGPVPVNVTYGVEGEAGVRYGANIAFLEADLEVDPFLDSAVYAQAGVDVGFAAVKATGRVKLLDDQLRTKLWVSMDQVNFDKVDLVASGDNDLSALDGAIELYAGAKIGGFDRSYSDDLFRWDGYVRNDRLFDVQESIALR